MINPYAAIDFNNVDRLTGITHQHLLSEMSGSKTPQASYDEIHNTGVNCFAISRYRPSLVTYPFNYNDNSFVYIANPFDSTLPLDQLKRDYAYTVSITDDVIGLPNAEHIYPLLYFQGAWNKWSSVHINGLGSTYESGLFPAPDTGYMNQGAEISYTELIDNIINALSVTDGGGVIINHPYWTENNKHFNYSLQRFITDCIDYDGRVLGTDIIDSGRQTGMAENASLIDNILKTGRKCWIFCQGDWNRTRGRNEILIPKGLTRSEKEAASLRAYRNGAFFGRYANSDMYIKSVSLTGGTFSIEAPNADSIDIIIDGETINHSGTVARVTVPESATYVRAVAKLNRDTDPNWSFAEDDVYKDLVFTNPIIVNPKEYPYVPAYDDIPTRNTKKDWLLLWG